MLFYIDFRSFGVFIYFSHSPFLREYCIFLVFESLKLISILVTYLRLRDGILEWILKSLFTSILIYLLLLDKRRDILIIVIITINVLSQSFVNFTRSTFNAKQFIDIMLRIIMWYACHCVCVKLAYGLKTFTSVE